MPDMAKQLNAGKNPYVAWHSSVERKAPKALPYYKDFCLKVAVMENEWVRINIGEEKEHRSYHTTQLNDIGKFLKMKKKNFDASAESFSKHNISERRLYDVSEIKGIPFGVIMNATLACNAKLANSLSVLNPADGIDIQKKYMNLYKQAFHDRISFAVTLLNAAGTWTRNINKFVGTLTKNIAKEVESGVEVDPNKLADDFILIYDHFMAVIRVAGMAFDVEPVLRGSSFAPVDFEQKKSSVQDPEVKRLLYKLRAGASGLEQSMLVMITELLELMEDYIKRPKLPFIKKSGFGFVKETSLIQEKDFRIQVSHAMDSMFGAIEEEFREKYKEFLWSSYKKEAGKSKKLFDDRKERISQLL